jgi:hypothetical protein
VALGAHESKISPFSHFSLSILLHSRTHLLFLLANRKKNRLKQQNSADNTQEVMIHRAPKHRLPTFLFVSSLVAVSALACDMNPFKSLFNVVKESVVATATVSGVYKRSIPQNALEACPIGSKNCIRTSWIPPPGTTKEDSEKTITKVLQGYPQEGQNGIDLSGWSFAEDSLAASGSARLEYRSGVGKIAKAINGGKPFIDDLLVAVQDDGQVEVRSSSRIGYSDMGVNKKRLEYLIKSLPKDWKAPNPDYKMLLRANQKMETGEE